ncbi:transcriptional regulator [Naumannella sp. ID2617S]|nr:transcriptional regulator [Naumannella sp. ID2617S]
MLSYLVEVAMPVTVRQVSASSGQHANTVREHLDALVDAGMVERSRKSPNGRGRPAICYRALPNATALHSTREYASLVDALAAHLSRRSADPVAESIEVGRTWGDQFDADADATQTLHELGFEPSSTDEEEGAVRLLTCPLLASARRSPEVVCNVHLGLLRQIAGDGVELEPFVEGGCLVRLPAAG